MSNETIKIGDRATGVDYMTGETVIGTYKERNGRSMIGFNTVYPDSVKKVELPDFSNLKDGYYWVKTELSGSEWVIEYLCDGEWTDHERATDPIPYEIGQYIPNPYENE